MSLSYRDRLLNLYLPKMCNVKEDIRFTFLLHFMVKKVICGSNLIQDLQSSTLRTF